jgi:hypothetical protein
MNVRDIKIALSRYPLTRKVYQWGRNVALKIMSVWHTINSKKERAMSDMHGVAELKGSMQGKRCFIIGTGPSLRLSDLDLLKNEDCFGTNTVFKIFDQTRWRPKYYVSMDDKVLQTEVYKNLTYIANNCEFVFIRRLSGHKLDLEGIPENVRFMYVREFFTPDSHVLFSDDIVKQVYASGTVTYMCMQIAAWLGYTEIYLLGVDCNYSFQSLNGVITKTDTVSDHMETLEYKNAYMADIDMMKMAYVTAAEECGKRGIIIKNATRGGRLEIFPRVDFDSLFS